MSLWQLGIGGIGGSNGKGTSSSCNMLQLLGRPLERKDPTAIVLPHRVGIIDQVFFQTEKMFYVLSTQALHKAKNRSSDCFNYCI